MFLPTNTPMDKLLGSGLEATITNIYGPAGSGKTNITLCAAISCLKSGRKVLYMDTEGNFSTERFQQLGGNDMKNIIFLSPSSWSEQHKEVIAIEKLFRKHDIGLVVIDSLVSLYRLELTDNNFKSVNKQLATQFSILSRICREKNIPVLVTSQVHSTRDKNGIDNVDITSSSIARYWSKTLVELKRTNKPSQRIAILRRHRSQPEEKTITFIIEQNRLKEKSGLF
ncbi:MAG: DNA repair and recombination protein RadB [Candidatus Aenigmatarchaeota archaeon]